MSWLSEKFGSLMKHIIPRELNPILPIVGAGAGFALGGPAGAAAGAGLGSYAQGSSARYQGADISSTDMLKSAAISAGLAYGGAKLFGPGAGPGKTVSGDVSGELAASQALSAGGGGPAAYAKTSSSLIPPSIGMGILDDPTIGTAGVPGTASYESLYGGTDTMGSPGLPGTAAYESLYGNVGMPTPVTGRVGADETILARGGEKEEGMLGDIGQFLGENKGKLFLGGVGLDYLTKAQGIKGQQEAYGAAMDKYLGEHKAATEWTDADRQGMMKALMGIYAESAEAQKRKAASSAAARGMGGGTFGKAAESIKRTGLETAARSLATTYGPSGQPPSAAMFLGQAGVEGRSAGTETMEDLLGLGGQMGSMYLLSQMLR